MVVFAVFICKKQGKEDSTQNHNFKIHRKSRIKFQTVVQKRSENLESENEILRECVYESSRVQDSLSDDVKHLMVLNADLETAVEMLKGEIWSLNEQLRTVRCLKSFEI